MFFLDWIRTHDHEITKRLAPSFFDCVIWRSSENLRKLLIIYIALERFKYIISLTAIWGDMGGLNNQAIKIDNFAS